MQTYPKYLSMTFDTGKNPSYHIEVLNCLILVLR